MAFYVLLRNADDEILEEVDGDIRFRSGTPPTLRPEKGMRWLPFIVTNPIYDATTQVKEGPILTVNADNVTRVWTVRSKTAQELDEDKDKIAISILRLVKPLITALNDGTFISGSNYTNSQMKAILKAHL
jgi:hypothetical protein